MLAVCVLIGPVCGLAPLGLAPLLHAMGLGLLLAYRADHRRWPVPDRRIALAIGALAGWIVLSCLWANARLLAWEKLPEVLAIAAWALIVPSAVRDMPVKDAALASRALTFSIIAGLILCFGDIALGSPIKRLHWRWSDVPVNAYDREIVSFAVFLWPAALVRFRDGHPRSAFFLLGFYAIAILSLQSHSAMLGMMLGLGVLGLAWKYPAAARQGLQGLCAAGFALCIPVGLLLQKYGFDQRAGLQSSFRDRVQIWHFTADRILNWPLAGLGFEGSRAIPVGDLPPNFLPLQHDVPPLHPHDLFLQIWLELGFIGACIALFVMSKLLAAISRLAPPAGNFMLAGVTSYLAMAAFAFGIWQGWWLAALVLLVALTLLAAKDRDTPYD